MLRSCLRAWGTTSTHRPANSACLLAQRPWMTAETLRSARNNATAAGDRGERDAAGPAADGADASHAAAEGGRAADPQFTVLSDTIVHKRYMAMYNRSVQYPSLDGTTPGPVLEYDVVGHPQADFHFAVVFPWHPGPGGGSVTLVREYAQGPNQLMWCLPTGAYDPRKHEGYQGCGQAELSEEAQLAGGRWEYLIPADHPGICEVKWCRNRFHAFLCIDPHPDEQPGARDQEEIFLQVVRVPLPELRQLMLSGDMLLPSVATCFLALERLQQLEAASQLKQQPPLDGQDGQQQRVQALQEEQQQGRNGGQQAVGPS